MTDREIIRNAISRSISHTEIVSCTVSAHDDIDQAITELVQATQHSGWDYNDENHDDEGRQVLDVFSLDDESADAWRIRVTFEVDRAGCA